MSLVTAGWILSSSLLAASLCGVYRELVVLPRRERFGALLEIVARGPGVPEFWAPEDWHDA